jgi:hypothetical protein
MNNEPNRYYAYLLRLWPESANTEGAAGWRATLEDARSGERLGFASLEQLFTHLMQLAETSRREPGEATHGPSQSIA